MRSYRSVLALMLALSAALGPLAAAQAGPPPDKRRGMPITVTRQDGAYCFPRPLSFGSTVIAGGKCYTFYVIRTSRGAFLAFGPPGPHMIPPGQLVRLSTPAGAKVKGRLFYLVPIPVSVVVIPVDTIRVVNVTVIPRPDRLVISIPER